MVVRALAEVKGRWLGIIEVYICSFTLFCSGVQRCRVSRISMSYIVLPVDQRI